MSSDTQEPTTQASSKESSTNKVQTYKIFVGNLSPDTKDEELEGLFKDIAEVLSVKVIKSHYSGKGTKSFGFVEFKESDDATKAVNEMNNKEVKGNPLNVEIARSRQDGKRKRYYRNYRRNYNKKSVSKANDSNGQQTTTPPQDDNEKSAPKSKSNSNSPPQQHQDQNKPKDNSGDASSAPQDNSQQRSQNHRNSNNTSRRRYNGRRKNFRRGFRPNKNRALSEDTLFVSNIPYEAVDDDLKGYFDGYDPIEAHIVRGKNGTSFGFGFVVFENSQKQTDALAVDSKKITKQGGRVLSLFVTKAYRPEEGSAEKQTPAQNPSEEEKGKSDETQAEETKSPIKVKEEKGER